LFDEINYILHVHVQFRQQLNFKRSNANKINLVVDLQSIFLKFLVITSHEEHCNIFSIRKTSYNNIAAQHRRHAFDTFIVR